MSKRDYYEVLGVPRTADELALKTAYRKLARQFHPDVNKAPDSEERLKEINEAYGVLSDPDKRAAYDRYGHAATQGGPGGPGGFGGAGGFGGFGGFSDIFDEFFGGFAGQRTPQRGPARGRDLRYNMEITFREAVFGADKEIEIPRLEVCPVCQGSGSEPGTQAPCVARSATAPERCAASSRRSWGSSSASASARAARASARSSRRRVSNAAGASA